MKIFYVTADFELSEKPSWLDSFRTKYDDPYGYHITLKQATYFEESQLNEIEETTKKIAANIPPLQVSFNELFINKTPKGHVIMIKAEPNTKLTALQKELREKLSVFGDVIAAYYKVYEEHFEPHITIARHLSDEKPEKKKKNLGEDSICAATISHIFLKTNTIDRESEVTPEYVTSFILKNTL